VAKAKPQQKNSGHKAKIDDVASMNKMLQLCRCSWNMQQVWVFFIWIFWGLWRVS